MLESVDAAAILRRALAAGGEFADIYYEDGAYTSVACEDGKVERVLSAADRGIGIRVISGFSTAYAYTNQLSQESLLQLADTVSRGVRGGVPHPDFNLCARKSAPGYPAAIPPDQVELARKVDLVGRADRAARGFDPRVRQVLAVYRDARVKTQSVNSLGEFHEESSCSTVFIVQVVARDGAVTQTGYEPLGAARGFELFDGLPPEELALKAAARGVMMLGARKSPSGQFPVVLSSEAGGTMVHEAIGHGLEADLVQAGSSVYRGRIGERVASELITVVDDATIPHARGCFGFDSEGTAAQRTVLVENGVLKGYLYDRLSAMKDGCASTGNGRRESYRNRPIVRMTNTLIAPGQSDPAEIVKSVSNGLFVKRMGGGQVNTVTGDFVFEVSEGYLIENGVVSEPVRGATLAGNGPEVLRQISMVGNDLGFGIGTCGKDGQGVPVSDAQPTLLIPAITVGGAR
ncbi:TldD/PmbA family protein [Geomonas subterranea]|uniref:TldD/PmbA family protein n=1 Tax=Geomonas subterranea TaxID=2847989 RepID=A0ABX8LME8_9BACT|nr:TldD/PmbA family protein [Geomonas subterranea]QXE92501.1 TldD/PmbA family protein [Geomonas subterranea]QXM09400.1 TldD/PmbA family protein [Geomonas subterranea]